MHGLSHIVAEQLTKDNGICKRNRQISFDFDKFTSWNLQNLMLKLTCTNLLKTTPTDGSYSLFQTKKGLGLF